MILTNNPTPTFPAAPVTVASATPTVITNSSSESSLDANGATFSATDTVSLGYQPTSEVSAKDMRALFTPSATFNQGAQVQAGITRTSANFDASIDQDARVGGSLTDPTGTFTTGAAVTYQNSLGAGANIDLKSTAASAHLNQGWGVGLETNQEFNPIDGASVYRNTRFNGEESIGLAVSGQNTLDSNGVNAGWGLDVGGKMEAKSTSTTGLNLGGNKLEWESEQKLAADAHANAKSELVVSSNEVRLGAGFDVAAEAGVADKETVRAQSANGSLAQLSGDVSVGEGASAKAGFGFARTNNDSSTADGGGSTELSFVLGGELMAGAGVEGKVKITDADIDTAMKFTNPLLYAVGGAEVVKTGLSLAPTVLGGAAEAVGGVKESVMSYAGI